MSPSLGPPFNSSPSTTSNVLPQPCFLIPPPRLLLLQFPPALRSSAPLLAPLALSAPFNHSRTSTTMANAELDPKYDDYDYPVVSPVAQDGHPGHLTPEQVEKLKQLRTTLEGKGYTARLDTLTLVCGPRVAPKLCASMANARLYSCASCAPASSTLLLPRRCETPPSPHPDSSHLAKQPDGTKGVNVGAYVGSLVPSNGGKRPSWMNFCPHGIIPRRRRSSNTTLSTTTRPTRYALPRPTLQGRETCAAVANIPTYRMAGRSILSNLAKLTSPP